MRLQRICEAAGEDDPGLLAHQPRTNSVTEDTLKPCPFCGKAPHVYPKKPETEGNAWGEVCCENVCCPTYDAIAGRGVRVLDGAIQSDERGSMAYKTAAIRRWNRRVPSATPQGPIA